MAVLIFRKVLRKLMSNGSPNSTNFAKYIKSVLALSGAITDETNFTKSSQDVKEWISAFKVIFAKAKIDMHLQKQINKYSKVVTKLYFKLLQWFHQHEPTYIQEFYCRWKEIVSSMSSYVRAKSFIQYIDQFKFVTKHLVDAGHRFEQMTIMQLLRLYTENVTYDDVKATGNDSHIIEKIIEMGNEASLRELHDFLDQINVNSDIFTVKPTNVIIVQQSFTFCTSEYDMWIDFNLKSDSVIFVAVSLTHEEDQCMAIVSLPQIKENVFMGNYIMIVSGYWSLLLNNEEVTGGAQVKLMIVSPIHVRNMISQPKYVFKFVSSDYADPNIEDVNRNLKKMKESYDSDTTVCFPSICYSSCSDGDESLCKKPHIGGGAITESRDGYDYDEELEVDWKLQDSKDSPGLTCKSLRIPSADDMNRSENWTSKNYEGGLDDNQEFIADASFSENQSENDEQFDILQISCNMSEEVLQENNVWPSQRMEVDTCLKSTAQYLHQPNLLSNMAEEVSQENNVSQPQRMEVNSCPISPSEYFRLNRKRVLSTGAITTSTYKENNGGMSLQIRSHNFSIIQETVNDVIRSVQSSSKYRHSNDIRGTNDYRTRLRPRIGSKRNINKTSNNYTARTTMRERRRAYASRVPTAATMPPKEDVNVDPVHQVENDDPRNRLEQLLTAITECRDRLSQIHANCTENLDQYFECVQSLLDNGQNFI